MSLLGIDIGTTACKVAAYSKEGSVLGCASREYPLVLEAGHVELSPREVWSAIVECIRTSATYTRNDEVTAVSVSSMSDTLTPLDKNGDALCNSIVSFDKRAEAQKEALIARFGTRDLFESTGIPPHCMHPACENSLAPAKSSGSV